MAISSTNTTASSENLRQVSIEMWHPGCWGLELNDQFEGAHFIEKSTCQAENHIKADLIFIVEHAADMGDMLELARAHENVCDLTVLKRTGNRARILAKYNKEKSVIPTITNTDLMAVEPFHIKNGHKYWTVVAESGALSSQIEILEEQFQINVKSIHDYQDTESVEYADIVDQLYSALSPRQREAMFTAIREGYYQWPRDVSADTIAESMGISGPTFLEHLRTGEQKIINNLFAKFEQRHQNELLPHD